MLRMFRIKEVFSTKRTKNKKKHKKNIKNQQKSAVRIKEVLLERQSDTPSAKPWE